MRNIKEFKLFEAKYDPILLDLKDICIEMKDSGFRVEVWDMSTHYSKLIYKMCYGIDISIGQRKTWFSKDKETKKSEVFLFGSVYKHLESYMKGLGFDVQKYQRTDDALRFEFKIRN
jgi:hypothetical protein